MEKRRASLTLLTRAYCHLCDEMRTALLPIAGQSRVTMDEIDVDADPALEARFGDRVPVVMLGGIDGVELCHFRIDPDRVRDALERAS